MHPLAIVSTLSFTVDDNTPDGPTAATYPWLARLSADQPIYVTLDGEADANGLLLHGGETILLAIPSGTELSFLAVSSTAKVSCSEVKISAS